jgi:hypothetical protein
MDGKNRLLPGYKSKTTAGALADDPVVPAGNASLSTPVATPAPAPAPAPVTEEQQPAAPPQSSDMVISLLHYSYLRFPHAHTSPFNSSPQLISQQKKIMHHGFRYSCACLAVSMNVNMCTHAFMRKNFIKLSDMLTSLKSVASVCAPT